MSGFILNGFVGHRPHAGFQQPVRKVWKGCEVKISVENQVLPQVLKFLRFRFLDLDQHVTLRPHLVGAVRKLRALRRVILI